jgi:hypothetical protein
MPVAGGFRKANSPRRLVLRAAADRPVVPGGDEKERYHPPPTILILPRYAGEDEGGTRRPCGGLAEAVTACVL